MALSVLARRVQSLLKIQHAQAIGPLDRPVTTVAVACGSGGEFLDAALSAGCDCLVTGEMRTCFTSGGKNPGAQKTLFVSASASVGHLAAAIRFRSILNASKMTQLVARLNEVKYSQPTHN